MSLSGLFDSRRDGVERRSDDESDEHLSGERKHHLPSEARGRGDKRVTVVRRALAAACRDGLRLRSGRHCSALPGRSDGSHGRANVTLASISGPAAGFNGT